ncbi:hypothetical protein B0H34DRAFT_784631 [Crassisporium funariophilum]|nr:hypothetical protein B0H34DRAFT_784631 [Crassisporium funariophilum]
MSCRVNELGLRILSDLPLQSLIASRGVCTKWRGLVPHTDMAPARRAMLSFYDALIPSPVFQATRLSVIANLKPFDRQAYINKLLKQYSSLPEHFKLWILEWPSKAIIAGLWPGLPRKKYKDQFKDNVNVLEGANWLVFPQVTAITYKDMPNRRAYYIPALLVRTHRSMVWLILDERSNMCGKVYTSGTGSDVVSNLETVEYPFDVLDKDWIAYLQRIWIQVEQEAESCKRLGIPTWETLEEIPVDKSSNSSLVLHELGTKCKKLGRLRCVFWPDKVSEAVGIESGDKADEIICKFFATQSLP